MYSISTTFNTLLASMSRALFCCSSTTLDKLVSILAPNSTPSNQPTSPLTFRFRLRKFLQTTFLQILQNMAAVPVAAAPAALDLLEWSNFDGR